MFRYARCFMVMTIFIIIGTGHALAECHFRPENAIICETPANAVAAYKMYGMDFDLAHKDYSLKVLHSSGCNGMAVKEDLPKFQIKETGRARFATPNGWVEFAEIFIYKTFTSYGGKAETDWVGPSYIVTDYLVGTCEKYVQKVEHYTVPLPPPP